jgi:hypothetical protein
MKQKILYDFSDPSKFKLHRLIRDLTDNKDLREKFFKSPDEVIRSYGLNDKDKEVLLRADPVEMFEYGISPYLIHDYRLVVLGFGNKPPEIQVVYKGEKSQ